MFPTQDRSRVASFALVVIAATVAAVGCRGNASSTSDANSAGTTTGRRSTQSSASERPSDGFAIRVALNRLFGEHMMLLTNASQQTMVGAADESATVDALSANTDELSEMIGYMYGDKVAAKFTSQWDACSGFLVDYSTAVSNRDVNATATAMAHLSEHERPLAAVLASMTDLPAPIVQRRLALLFGDTTKSVDEFAAQRYAAASTAAAAGNVHMSALADWLALAMAQQQQLRSTSGAAAELQMSLDRLLSQHTLLTTFAMQRSYDNSADRSAALAALATNTTLLGDAMGARYGPNIVKMFEARWRARTQLFIDYASAAIDHHDAAQTAAQAMVTTSSRSLAAYISTTTGVDRAVIAGALRMDTKDLLKTFDDYASGDFDPAYQKADEAYAHMFDTGAALAGAMAAH